MKDLIEINITRDHECECGETILGRAGEGHATRLEIKIPETDLNYSAYLDFKKPDGETVRTPKLSVSGGVATYDISQYILDEHGDLEVQLVLQFTSGEIWKSWVKKFAIQKSINAEGEAPQKEDFFTEAQKVLGSIESLQKDVAEIKENMDDNINVPDYWLADLQNGAEAINTAMCEAGRNKSAFLFYSDAHWNYGSQMSPKLLKYLYKNTGMTKTFFGGDIVNDEASDYDTMAYLWDWRKQLKDLPNHHSVVGNHDDGNSTNNLFSAEYVYGYLLAPEETPDMVLGDGLYYYIDNPTEKTRYICLDTGYQTSATAQTTMRAFLTEALKSTQSGWHIVVISHIWYGPDYDRYSERPIPIAGMSNEAYQISMILDNYNAKIGDFKSCGAKVEFCIGGHVHRDYVDSTEGGIPIVLVETDSMHLRSAYSYRAGTTTESSVNGIVADYNTNTLHVIRIGRGDSYDVDLSNAEVSENYSVVYNLTNVASSSTVSSIAKGEAYTATLTATSGTIKSVVVTMGGTDITSTAYNANTGSISISAVTGAIVITAVAMADAPTGDYTNVLLTALSADGKSVYNGKGWKENTRWSESGQVEDNSDGSYLTGYIPVSKGDVIYCSGINLKNDTNSGKVLYVNTLGTSSGSHNGSQLNTDASATWHDDGTIKSFVITGDRPYIRIACNGITDSSIITKNEPIESSDNDTDYTNVLKTAIAKDGTPFNGGKGWADNSRIGSGGIYLGNGTAFVTGHIKIDRTKDNTFYLKNVIFDSTTANNYLYMVAVFDSSRTRTTFAPGGNAMYPDSDIKNYCEAVIVDNNIIQFTIGASKFASNNEYIAICCSYLGDDSIITINEPIE